MRNVLLRVIATVLIVFGIGVSMTSSFAFGDIGLSMLFAGIVGILAGVGLWLVKSN